MKLLVVRHGESEMNVSKQLAGHLPTPLTEKGIEQARALGAFLQNESISWIYSSDILRARQTTEYILEYVQAPCSYDARLRERTWGELDSASHEQYFRLMQEAAIEYHRYRPPGGESIEDVRQRVRPLIAELLHQHRGETVLLSGHHTMNKSLIFELLQLPWEQWSELHQDNTCINVFELAEEDSWRAIRINWTPHFAD